MKTGPIPLLPRLIRLRDAPFYVGMDRNRFNAAVRPQLTEIPIGTQGIAFDRVELDAWVDQYKSRNGRPGLQKGDRLWDAKECRGSTAAGRPGTLTRSSTDSELLSVSTLIDVDMFTLSEGAESDMAAGIVGVQ